MINKWDIRFREMAQLVSTWNDILPWSKEPWVSR